VNLNEANQLRLYKELARFYPDFPFPKKPDGSSRYYYDNPYFGSEDAFTLFSMMRHFRPKRIIEVGSGYSSAVMLDTNERFLDKSVATVFIEPFPQRLHSLLREADSKQSTIIPSFVQDVDIKVFDSLEAGDVLFIDSSHIAKVGSDVVYLFFEVLPRLKAGVFVHFHDIFWPFEYPADWHENGFSFNEAYVLRAFLEFNSSFEIVFFNSWIAQTHQEEVARSTPLLAGPHGVSIWLRRTR
jgi:hypothetical protein